MPEDRESRLITLIRTRDQPWLNDIAKYVQRDRKSVV